MKKTFFHGIIAGMLSASACIIYLNIYQNSLGTDFNKLANIGTVSGLSIIACMLMALSYRILEKLDKENLKGVLNLLIALLSFASIILPIGKSLPLDIKDPELFPGLVIPMHFFPALAFFCIAPFFKEKKTE